MDKKKNREKTFNKIMTRIFITLLIGFIVLSFSKSSGYYEFSMHKKVEMNEEQISKFEKDIKDGKNINLEDYVKETDVSYQNLASDIGYGMSSHIGTIVSDGMDNTFGFLSKLFEG